eukprot:jgi/Ulvmu1/1233/UM109_0031.1
MRLQQLLEQSVSSSLLNDSHRRFPILCFKESDTITLALEKLATEGLVSALVVSDTAQADQDEAKTKKQNAESRLFSRVLVNEIKGFVDLSVVLHSFLRRVFEGNVVTHSAQELERIAEKFCAERVGSLLDDGVAVFHGPMARDWALKGEESASMNSIIRQCFLFSKPGSIMRPPKSPAKSIHHVAMYVTESPSNEDKISGIISQTDVVRCLHSHEHQGGHQGNSICHKTVKELGLVGFCSTDVPPSPSTTSSETSERRGNAALGSRLTLVPSNETALEAFRRMCMNRDCGVGVLAPDGTLKHHLSAADLRSLRHGRFHTLLMPVDAFLEQRPLAQDARHTTPAVGAPEEPPGKRRRTAAAPIKGVLTCQATSSLAEVIAIMATHDVHQVYVVDPDSKPLSAITMADVLRTVVNAAAPPPTLASVCRDRIDTGPGGFPRGGTPATPNAAEAAVRTSALLNESAATSGQSDRAMSVCTSVQSVPQVTVAARPLEGSGSVVEASVVVGTAEFPDGGPGEPETEAGGGAEQP